jgi:phenylacetate-CoA ligase
MTPQNLKKLFDSSTPRNWTEQFFRFDTAAFEKLLTHKDEMFWQRLGAQRALTLFHEAARRVPAYRAFLKTHHINTQHIRTVADFSKLPTTTKKNYIDAYPLEKRCWDGRLSNNSIVAMSSGTSGEPKFWPRGGYAEYEAAIIHELAYRSLFSIQKRRTLLVIGFPMGIYVSGIATLLPSWLVAQRGYDVTLVATGNTKADMVRIVEHLGQSFEQVVLIGHPFFIKDVVETGASQGIDWKSLKISMLYCSEGFNEEWRAHISTVAGIPTSSIRAFNTYGSSETLLVAHETPASIALRQAMERSDNIHSSLVETPYIPNVFQYNPLFRYIESSDGALAFTSDNGIPLIKYDLGDGGTIVPFAQAAQHLSSRELRGAWKLPFITLDGRRDHTIIFYAANIYPEHIHLALNKSVFLRKITGKFAMRKDYLPNKDQFLEINVELRPNEKPTPELTISIEESIVEKLLTVNMEYAFLSKNLDKNIRPRVVLHSYQNDPYFRPGLKPRYIVK